MPNSDILVASPKAAVLADTKLQILKEGRNTHLSICQVCEQYQISPTPFCQWERLAAQAVLKALSNQPVVLFSISLFRRRKTMPNVIHFEICVDDLEAATNFYSSVFGWEIERGEEDSDYWLITTGDDMDPGITGALTSRLDEYSTTINTIEVLSLDSCAKKIAKAGGTILAPKISIPGMGYVQYCQDLEGNTFGIMEFDESAQ